MYPSTVFRSQRNTRQYIIQEDTEATVVAPRRLSTSDLAPAEDEDGYYAHLG